ncbi:MAG: SCP2 sterol-binding domain-containing protein [Candidatus Thorarchaeota archaeon]
MSTKEKKDLLGMYAKLRDVLANQAGTISELNDSGIRKAVDSFKKTDLRGSILVHTINKKKREHWYLTLDGKASKVRKDYQESADLEIFIKADLLQEILMGKISPIKAMVEGGLRARGDLKKGQRLFRLLAGDKGKTTIC